jgi:hypothetical protein
VVLGSNKLFHGNNSGNLKPLFMRCTDLEIKRFSPMKTKKKVYGRTASVVLCSEIMATDPEVRVRFPALRFSEK